MTTLAWAFVLLVAVLLAYRLLSRWMTAKERAIAAASDVESLRAELAKLDAKVAALSFRAGG